MAQLARVSNTPPSAGPRSEEPRLYNGYKAVTPERKNKPFRKNKVSTTNTIITLVLLAMITVLYINNTITVNHLAEQVDQLQKSHAEIQNMNGILEAEINRKSSLERIKRIATLQLGMTFPDRPPIWFDLQDTQLSDRTQE